MSINFNEPVGPEVKSMLKKLFGDPAAKDEKTFLDPNCSQTVFRCDRCGAYDYGDPGGPGYAECREACRATE